MTTTVFPNGRSQAVRIPKELRFDSNKVSIRRLGDGLILEPVKSSEWPEGFFDGILISDPAFTRMKQGKIPSIADLSK